MSSDNTNNNKLVFNIVMKLTKLKAAIISSITQLVVSYATKQKFWFEIQLKSKILVKIEKRCKAEYKCIKFA